MTASPATRLLRGATPFGAWLAACSTLLMTSPAWADAQPQVLFSINSPVPAGGVVRGLVSCVPACEAPLPSLGVPGTFVANDSGLSSYRDFVFVPDPPLEPGTYSAWASGTFNTVNVSFTVVEATLELPTFTSYVTATAGQEGEPILCEEVGADSQTTWFTPQTRVRANVSVTVQGLYRDQYRYSLRLPGETRDPVGSGLSRSFEVEGDELCFDVIGFSYQDDSVTEIGQECVDLTGLGVGVKDEMAGDFRRTLLGCVVPPQGYEEDWCKFFEPAFTSKSCDAFTLDSCFSARRACPAGDQPSAEQEQNERDARKSTAATGGTTGAGGGGGSGANSGGKTGAGGGGSGVDGGAGGEMASRASGSSAVWG
jgi:uncharacterized membrane protein YgcG